DAPDATYEKHLQSKDMAIAGLVKTADDAATAQKSAEESKTTAETKQKEAENQSSKLKSDNDKDTTNFQDLAKAIGTQVASNLTAAKERDVQRGQKDAGEKEREKMARTIKERQGRLDKALADLKKARDELEDAQTRLAAVAEKAGIDTRVMHAE